MLKVMKQQVLLVKIVEIATTEIAAVVYDFPLSLKVITVESTVHKRSSRYIKGIVIGAVSMFGFGIICLLGFLWVWLLTKKERAAKKYTEVKKQVHQEAS